MRHISLLYAFGYLFDVAGGSKDPEQKKDKVKKLDFQTFGDVQSQRDEILKVYSTLIPPTSDGDTVGDADAAINNYRSQVHLPTVSTESIEDITDSISDLVDQLNS